MDRSNGESTGTVKDWDPFRDRGEFSKLFLADIKLRRPTATFEIFIQGIFPLPGCAGIIKGQLKGRLLNESNQLAVSSEMSLKARGLRLSMLRMAQICVLSSPAVALAFKLNPNSSLSLEVSFGLLAFSASKAQMDASVEPSLSRNIPSDPRVLT
ncbi:hypothetical protein B0H17DRAFT_1123785 [Mycena rosella]|uniref:Uncharacterized protein n=1 Tax=Mycena rosella TaxID=1033263 RepID=A0AAD7H2E7_MYCRO|nr:hypothetical protein B0H17DRAFT_1123785 [Mycena rosella]